MIRRAPNQGGFTLVELLTAMAVGTIVLLAAAGLLGSASAIFQRLRTQISDSRENRTAITQLAADLSTAIVHSANRIDHTAAPRPRDFLGFLCLQPPTAQNPAHRLADLCAVYYSLRDLPTAQGTTRCLVRGFLESAESFEVLRSEQIDRLFQFAPQREELVALGVLAFEVRQKIRSPQGHWIDSEPSISPAPQAVQIRLTLARPALRARLTRPEDWDAPIEAISQHDLETLEILLPFGPSS